MAFYVTGDVHGNLDIDKLNVKNFKESSSLDKNDYLLICGDVAMFWDNGDDDFYTKIFYAKQPYTVLWIDGNHENFNLINQLPVEKWNGGKVHKIYDNIYHLMRGQVYNIDGHTIFTFGGAESHDKIYRTKNLSWWEQEMPSLEDLEEADKNLKKVNYKVDYVFTHCIYNDLQDYLSKFITGYNQNILTDYFQSLYEKLDYKTWYCGHYHLDELFSDKNKNKQTQILYNCILRIW